VGLGKALVGSSALKPGEPGLVIAPTTVLMQPGTYPPGLEDTHRRAAAMIEISLIDSPAN